MGALTHNGEVLQSLPANASQINFDKTGTDLNSTQTENAIKEVNTKANTNANDIDQLKSGLNELTANKLNGTDDITATTYDTAYVCPCDGYLMVSSNTDGTGTIRVVIADAISSEAVGFVYMNVTGQYQIEMVFLRKGLKVYISQATTNSVVRFKKLTT